MNLKAHKDPCGRVWIADEDGEIGESHRINHISTLACPRKNTPGSAGTRARRLWNVPADIEREIT